MSQLSPSETLSQLFGQAGGELPSGDSLSTAQVMALLASAQFDLVCGAPCPGTQEELDGLLRRFESLNADIIRLTNAEMLEAIAKIVDTHLAVHLPAAQLRKLIKIIVVKDPDLLAHMPQVSKMLRRVFREICVSSMLDPETLRRISAGGTNRDELDRGAA